MIVESIEELFDALNDESRRGAAAAFARTYVTIDPTRSATERLAEIIASS